MDCHIPVLVEHNAVLKLYVELIGKCRTKCLGTNFFELNIFFEYTHAHICTCTCTNFIYTLKKQEYWINFCQQNCLFIKQIKLCHRKNVLNINFNLKLDSIN